VAQLHSSNGWPGIKIERNLPSRGSGVVTTESFKKNDIVCSYRGRLTSYSDHVKRQEQRTDSRRKKAEDYRIYLDIDPQTHVPAFVLEGHRKSSFGPLINHSPAYAHPNVEPVDRIFTKPNGESHRMILFRARRNIPEGKPGPRAYLPHI
jgi:hypothetical protein